MNISEILLKYETDKNSGSDNNIHGHCYGQIYDEIFSKFDRGSKLKILEIGVGKGEDLLAYNEYFPNATITGIDIVDARINKDKNSSINFILSYINDINPEISFPDMSFDIIIDDGSHKLEDVLFLVKNYLANMSKNSYMIIEDVSDPKVWYKDIKY